jgi:hypothetical protein
VRAARLIDTSAADEPRSATHTSSDFCTHTRPAASSLSQRHSLGAGYRRALEPLVGHLGVLDDRGWPAVAAPKPAAPGLRFVGYTSRPGTLGFISRQAKRSAKATAHEVKSRR